MTKNILIYALFLATAIPAMAQAQMLSPHQDTISANIVSYDIPTAATQKPSKKNVKKSHLKTKTTPEATVSQGHPPIFQKNHLTVQQAQHTYVENAEKDGANEGYQQKFAPSWLAQNHVSAKNAQVYEQQENNIANRDAIKAREDEMTNEARIAKNPRARAIQKHLDEMSKELEARAHSDEHGVASQFQP